jgi:hypothetical protein
MLWKNANLVVADHQKTEVVVVVAGVQWIVIEGEMMIAVSTGAEIAECPEGQDFKFRQLNPSNTKI